MKLFSFSNGEPGFIAISQHARGVIAIGQMAVGVVVLGQLATGVVAVGQLGFGLVFGAGQLGVGVFCGGGLGIGGRGLGAVLPLVPSIEAPRDLPATTDFHAIASGWGDGWVAAELDVDEHNHVGLFVDGGQLPLRMCSKVLGQAYAEIRQYRSSSSACKVLAHLRRVDRSVVCDRLMHVPVPATARPSFWPLVVVRLVVLTAIAAVWFALVAPDLLRIFKSVF